MKLNRPSEFMIAEDAKAIPQSKLFTDTLNKVTFDISDIGAYEPNKNRMFVYLGGVKQLKGQHYIESSPTTITFIDPIPFQTNLFLEWYKYNTLSVQAAHSSNHKKGGGDELNIKDLAGYDEIVNSANQKSINVMYYPYALKGNGTNEFEAIQSLFNLANTQGSVVLYFPKGNYGIDGNVRVYKNTTVIMHPEAKFTRLDGRLKGLFVNGELDNTTYASAYSGEGNIHFIGGTIDLNSQNAGLAANDALSAFDISHADNVSFKYLTVLNGQNGHYFQIASSKNVKFYGCTFKDMFKTNTGSEDFEVIQIEEAVSDGSINTFPSFGSYDNTISKDIIIEECIFDNVVRGIGNHSYPKDTDNVTPIRYNRDIIIRNNTFKNISDKALHLEAYKNIIEDNTFESISDYSIYLYYTNDCNINKNRIVGCNKSAVYLYASSYNKLRDNTFINVCSDSGFAVIRSQVGSNYNEFSGTKIESTTVHSYPIYITDSTGNKINERNLPSGIGGNNGGKIYIGGGTSFMDTHFGQENIVLYSGELNMTTPTAALAEDMRGFSMIIIMGNDNSNATAGMNSMIIPKISLLVGATTSQFRFVPDITGGDRTDFSFPDYANIRVDAVTGTSHIRKIIGIR